MRTDFDALIDDVLKLIPQIDNIPEMMPLKIFQDKWNQSEDAKKVRANPKIDADMYCFFLWCNYRCKVMFDTETQKTEELIEEALQRDADERLYRAGCSFKNLWWESNPAIH